MSPPAFECSMLHPWLPVDDLAAAIDFYVQKLGFVEAFRWGDPPTTAGVDLGKVQVMLQKGPPAPATVYFVVDDIDALHAHQAARGVAIAAPPADKPWGLREYELRDPYGHTLRFGQHVPARTPPLKIDRVDVPVRLERRLAAVLAALAAEQGTTVSAVLEETLLHTFEGVSPHTPRTIARIAELKTAHGIDYDVHASYRFVE
jgi:uncharacterized glyoxalase superfamily protein PhnB